jgi:hypothetical protein
MMDLAAALEARAAVLTTRALDVMYANSFWQERFGERGRRRAEEDGRYHVTYLAEALRTESPEILVNYARWLRTVLVTRGMCSRHLAENFATLADAIRAEALPGGAEAERYLELAQAALVYPDDPARALQVAAPRLARRVTAVLYERHPDWLVQQGPRGRQRCQEDVSYHLSYLADALALDRVDLFADYIRWIAAFLNRRGIPRHALRETLDVLGENLTLLPARPQPAARSVLAAGQAVLAGDEN